MNISPDRTAYRFTKARAGLHLALLLILAVVLFAPLQASQAASTSAGDLDQCLNGTFASPSDCVGGINPEGWVNGNANGSHSHWAEGQSVPFRLKMTGMLNGQHILRIQYDYTVNNPQAQHAYDYLTTYNRSWTADVCSGFLTPCPAANTFPIPPDPVLPTCDSPQHAPGTGGIPEVPGDFTIFGGAISGAAYEGTHTCHDSGIQVTMRITFTSSAPEVAIAWGAHIAGEFDWGNGESAHAINGSPYHMRFIDLDGSGGNQDRSLQTNAVYSTDISTLVSDTALTTYSAVHDTANINGYLGGVTSTTPPIAGTLNFYICADNTLPFSAPYPDGCDHQAPGTLLTITPIQVNGNGSYQSPDFIPTQNGYYCFRAEFTPEGASPYPFARESNTLTSGGTAECFIVMNPTAVTVTSLHAGAPADWNGLLVTSIAALLLGMSVVVFQAQQAKNK